MAVEIEMGSQSDSQRWFITLDLGASISFMQSPEIEAAVSEDCHAHYYEDPYTYCDCSYVYYDDYNYYYNYNGSPPYFLYSENTESVLSAEAASRLGLSISGYDDTLDSGSENLMKGMEAPFGSAPFVDGYATLESVILEKTTDYCEIALPDSD